MTRIYHFFALVFFVFPIAASAQISYEGVKERAAQAARAVRDTAGDAADVAGKAARKAGGVVNETVDSTTKDLRDEATPEATRAKLDLMAEEALARLFAERPDSRVLFDRSVGYAVFDAREASFYVVAGYGRGVAVDRRTDAHTYMKMATAGAGASFGVGGFDRQVIVLFQDQGDFASFVARGLDATAQIGTMTGEKKDEAALRFNRGRVVFVLTGKGWKVAAKLTGSRYWPDEGLNRP